MLIRFTDGSQREVAAISFGKAPSREHKGQRKLHIFYKGPNGLLLKRLAKDIANITK